MSESNIGKKHGPDCQCGCQTLSSIEDFSEIFSLHKSPTFNVASIIAVHAAGVAAAAAYAAEGRLVKMETEYQKTLTSGTMPKKLEKMYKSIKDFEADLAQVIDAAEESDEEATKAVAAAAKATSEESKVQKLTANSVIADADASIAVAIADDVTTHRSEIPRDAIDGSLEGGLADVDADTAVAIADAAADTAKEIEFQVSEAKLIMENYIVETISACKNAIKASKLASQHYCSDDDSFEKVHKSDLPDRIQLLRHELFLSLEAYDTTWGLFTESHHELVDGIRGLFLEWGGTA